MFSYPHHIGDFIRDTARLSDSQCMAYLRLIWTYYDTESPLPNAIDKLAFQVGSSSIDVQLILEHFFTLEDGDWHHRRCDAEIEAYRKRSARSQKAASVRWNNAELCSNDASSMPGACPEHKNSCQPITDNREPITKTKEKDIGAKAPALDRFTPPTIDEVISYCKDRGNKVNPHKWFDHYTSNGWKVGRNKMKDWKAAVRTWEASEGQGKKTPSRDNFESKDYGEGGLL